MLLGFVVVNTILAVIYAVVKGAKRGSIGMAIFFVFMPGFGFAIYFIPVLMRRFSERVGVNREAVLTHAFDIERLPEHPDLRQALNVVPVEDAMAVAGNAEKRALLLDQLKKNLEENYKILMAAQEDDDSESAHYVAAAKMEIYRLHQARWLEARRDYEQDPDDPLIYHTACGVLKDMLASGVLSPREQQSYLKRLSELVRHRIDAAEDEVTQSEFEAYLNALVELGSYAEAELLWRNYADRMRSETTYQDMLKLYYQKGNRQKFESILEDLRHNRQVRLSSSGLEQLRYWSSRLSGATMSS